MKHTDYWNYCQILFLSTYRVSQQIKVTFPAFLWIFSDTIIVSVANLPHFKGLGMIYLQYEIRNKTGTEFCLLQRWVYELTKEFSIFNFDSTPISCMTCILVLPEISGAVLITQLKRKSPTYKLKIALVNCVSGNDISGNRIMRGLGVFFKFNFLLF